MATFRQEKSFSWLSVATFHTILLPPITSILLWHSRLLAMYPGGSTIPLRDPTQTTNPRRGPGSIYPRHPEDTPPNGPDSDCQPPTQQLQPRPTIQPAPRNALPSRPTQGNCPRDRRAEIPPRNLDLDFIAVRTANSEEIDTPSPIIT